MTEVVGPGGWLVDGEEIWAKGHEACWRQPYHDKLVKALLQAYDKGPAYQTKAKAARPHIEENYSLDVVRDQHWRPVLKQINAHFGLPT